ncbi:DNA mismatch repair protein MutL [Shewanella sp. UCD-FRSSP16_17]|uniref:DNA mismatch repair endonuclease MutL n=1 Tax=Shewanella sp. UCD-FRSSP16_17 TaxID=1853256 RepID=UPI0007EEBD59|nr:DNA mismatch repair endonuclease MutL [Shewanella sp. UCD-FRSSP16_17]OBT08255.1 DNA mismatch repair protein MutL [Shewanella sp. UCD-FRSSP16_17]
MAIQILPPQLANQIAAGEVVERPASVVKELVENSLDAGATRVDIEIDKGGSKLIRIRDNGKGIAKAELALALSRHATSKVHSLDDLEAILSFGFRGEALASISSVARLSLTSKPADQSEAWQANAAGSQMDVKITPAAHPIGTTIDVVDLFFNTPARRRFLKSDKTEFTHIDEWLKRIAIARTDVHFTLTHNGKLIRQYRPANTEIQYKQRLGQICGRSFAEHALHLACEHDGLSLSGYLQAPSDTQVTDSFYFYVNGRLVRDRLVNHAVKQAFGRFDIQHQPGYVLMLEIDPHQVDVNVHPAKHEVRFHQSRLVHDFILQALQSVLQQITELQLSPEINDRNNDNRNHSSDTAYTHVDGTHSSPVNQVSSSKPVQQHTGSQASSYLSEIEQQQSAVQHQPREQSRSQYGSVSVPAQGYQNSGGQYGGGGSKAVDSAEITPTAIANYGQLLQTEHENSSLTQINEVNISAVSTMPQLLDGRYWVMVKEQQLLLIDIVQVSVIVAKNEIFKKLKTGLVGQPLLMPVSIQADLDWKELLVERDILLRKLGLTLSIRYQQLIIKNVPPYLRDSQLAVLIPELLQWIKADTPTDEALALWIAQHQKSAFLSASQLWQQYCQLSDEQQAALLSTAQSLPWQTWLEENKSEPS